ncbi:MAG: hypothetical protein M0Q29_10945 [Thiopseudomonas sp.]|nr:hypothetical protein [Thiopseudomonas sp.]
MRDADAKPAGLMMFNTLGELEVPPIAIEELLVNALMHRDYFDSASIRILVFRDRIEIISPGHLPDNISTDEIKRGKTKRRNPVLSEHAAHVLPYRGLGSGINRALQAWPHIELQDHKSGNEFRAVITRPVSDVQVIAPTGIGAGDPVTGQVAPPVPPPVTPPVETLLLLIGEHGELSNAGLREYLAVNDRKHVRKSYIAPALKANLVEMTIPDKPNSRLQKYRLTQLGSVVVQQYQNKKKKK